MRFGQLSTNRLTLALLHRPEAPDRASSSISTTMHFSPCAFTNPIRRRTASSHQIRKVQVTKDGARRNVWCCMLRQVVPDSVVNPLWRPDLAVTSTSQKHPWGFASEKIPKSTDSLSILFCGSAYYCSKRQITKAELAEDVALLRAQDIIKVKKK